MKMKCNPWSTTKLSPILSVEDALDAWAIFEIKQNSMGQFRCFDAGGRYSKSETSEGAISEAGGGATKAKEARTWYRQSHL